MYMLFSLRAQSRTMRLLQRFVKRNRPPGPLHPAVSTSAPSRFDTCTSCSESENEAYANEDSTNRDDDEVRRFTACVPRLVRQASTDEDHVPSTPCRSRRLAFDMQRDLRGAEADDQLVELVFRTRLLMEICCDGGAVDKRARAFGEDLHVQAGPRR